MRIGWKVPRAKRSGESSLRSKPRSHILRVRHWKTFIRYKDKVKDYNFGSLIRTDAEEEYGEKNTIFGTSRVYHVDPNYRELIAIDSDTDAGMTCNSTLMSNQSLKFSRHLSSAQSRRVQPSPSNQYLNWFSHRHIATLIDCSQPLRIERRRTRARKTRSREGTPAERERKRGSRTV